MNTLLVALGLYALGLMLFGLWLGRRFAGAGSFFVGDRALGPGLLFGTLLAANIGAGSTVGAAGRGYANGISAWWWVGSAGLGTLLLAFWIGPRIWKLAKDHDFRTVGDYLDWRFPARGRLSLRLIVAVVLWVGTLAILAGQLIALAWVLDIVAGVDKTTGCLVGGLVMTVYFTAGGLRSSAWINAVQLVVMIAGFALAIPFALRESGGWNRVLESVPESAGDYLGFLSNGSSGWTYAFMLVPAFMVSPGLIQKIYGARDAQALRRGVGWSGAALLVFAAVPPVLGMTARAYDPALANPELALPLLLQQALPVTLAALGLAAIVSAELSSADAALFMLSTSLSEDLYRGHLRPEASDESVLRMARFGAVAGGVLGVLFAIWLQSVIAALSLFYSVLSVSLFVPVVIALNTRRGSGLDAICGLAAGVVLFFLARSQGWSGSWYNPSLIGIVASVVVYFGSATFRGSSQTPALELP